MNTSYHVRVDPDEPVHILILEEFGISDCVLQRLLSDVPNLLVAGIAVSLPVLLALANLVRPQVVIVHDTDDIRLAAALQQLRATLPESLLVAVPHLSNVIGRRRLCIAGAHRALDYSHARQELAMVVQDLVASYQQLHASA